MLSLKVIYLYCFGFQFVFCLLYNTIQGVTIFKHTKLLLLAILAFFWILHFSSHFRILKPCSKPKKIFSGALSIVLLIFSCSCLCATLRELKCQRAGHVYQIGVEFSETDPSIPSPIFSLRLSCIPFCLSILGVTKSRF